MQTRNGNLIIADLVGSTRHLGTKQEMQDLGSGWGEPRWTEVTEAGGPSMLSKAVVVSVVQGVEQVRAGGWEGVVGKRAEHILRGKEAVAASISNQQRVLSAI
jgi:hypothetical protein